MKSKFCPVIVFIFLSIGVKISEQQYARNPYAINGRRTNNGLNLRSQQLNDPTIIQPYPSGDSNKDVEDAGVPPPPSASYDNTNNNKPPVISSYDAPNNVNKNSGVLASSYPSNEEPKSDYDEDYGGVTDESIGANGCICVPYYQCEDGKIVTDGSGLIDPRRITPPKQEIPLDSNFRPPFCGTFHVCCSDPEASTQKPYIHKCGVRNPSGINRRILSPADVGESDFGEWPWQAAILKYENGANLFQCGGVLIDHFHILTVAHCVQAFKNKQNKLIIRLGEWDTQKTTEFLPHEDYKISAIIIHPSFRNNSLWNDIAVLELEKKVEYRPNIESICLPTQTENFDGQKCVTTGWGKNAYKGGSYSNILKEVSLPVLSYHDCQTALRTTRLGQRFRLHDSFICAGGEEGVDACKGDGGGPLVCYREDGTYALAGLVSWGIDCGKPGVPGVYVKVGKFLDWISQQTHVDIKEYWPQTTQYSG